MKRIAILMEIDDGHDPEKFSYSVRSDTLRSANHYQLKGAEQTYRVVVNEQEAHKINPGIESQDAVLDAAAHELGHVLSQIFNTKAMLNDPRTKGEFVGMKCEHCEATPDQAARVYANEVEAWKHAEKMRPVDQYSKNKTLKAYTEWGYNDPDANGDETESKYQQRKMEAMEA